MARQAHILWIIDYAPESSTAGSSFARLDDHTDGAAYELARQLWMSQIESHPQNTVILGNAASFLTLCDKTKCGELLRRAKTLEPENPRWTERLRAPLLARVQRQGSRRPAGLGGDGTGRVRERSKAVPG